MAERLASAKEPLVVALLGGGHDLSEPLSRHAPAVRYVRLTVDAYWEVAGERVPLPVVPRRRPSARPLSRKGRV